MCGANRFSSLPGDHTLADEKATIGPRINALHHRERAAGCNIEDVSLKAGHRQSASDRLLDRRLHGLLDGGNILWFADNLHTAHWIGSEVIDWKHRQDCRDGTLHCNARQTDQPTRSGRPGNSRGRMIAVDDGEIVTVTHGGENPEKIR